MKGNFIGKLLCYGSTFIIGAITLVFLVKLNSLYQYKNDYIKITNITYPLEPYNQYNKNDYVNYECKLRKKNILSVNVPCVRIYGTYSDSKTVTLFKYKVNQYNKKEDTCTYSKDVCKQTDVIFIDNIFNETIQFAESYLKYIKNGNNGNHTNNINHTNHTNHSNIIENLSGYSNDNGENVYLFNDKFDYVGFICCCVVFVLFLGFSCNFCYEDIICENDGEKYKQNKSYQI